MGDDDILDGDSGPDILDGGAGDDTATYHDAGSAVVVDLTVIGPQDTRGDGVDTLVSIENIVGSAFDDRLTGSDGDNRLEGLAGDDILRGRAGADTLIGGDGDDILYPFLSLTAVAAPVGGVIDGGAGDDTVRIESDVAPAILVGGEGVDTLVLNNDLILPSFSVANGFELYVGGSLFSLRAIRGDDSDNILDFSSVSAGLPSIVLRVIGGLGDDVITGLAGDQDDLLFGDDDSPFGVGGDDTLYGVEGDDYLSGDEGDDRLYGGAGDDRLYGGEGVDLVDGGDGDDMIFALHAWSGADSIDAGAGDDRVETDGITAVLQGGTGVDTLAVAIGLSSAILDGFSAANGFELYEGGRIDGTAGDNVLDFSSLSASWRGALLTLSGRQGDDWLSGLAGSAADRLLGEWGDDTIFGNGGDDTLSGGDGADVLYGGDGADVLEGNAGDDQLEGGDGSDTASFLGVSSAVTVNLTILGRQDTGGGGLDDLVSIENLTGSGYDDLLIGDAGANRLDGGASADVLVGGLGDDYLDGGVSRDAASYASATAGVIVDLSREGPQDTIAAGVDTLVGIEEVIGSDFADQLGGALLGGAVIAGAGDDVVTINNTLASQSVSLGSGSDRLILGANLGPNAIFAAVTVSDFQAGDGDRVEFAGYLATFQNYVSGANPFLSRHVRLLQNGLDTLFQVDRNGGGDSYATVLTLKNVVTSTLAAVNLAGFEPQSPAARLDFSGDGKADILWRNPSGEVAVWSSTLPSGFSSRSFGTVGLDWTIQRAADVSGDGRADIIWRNAGGELLVWRSTPTGGFASTSFGIVGLDWKLQAAGDLTGDGKADVLWRNDDGSVLFWKADAAGTGFVGQDLGRVGADWKLQQAADFTGDGQADILWRNDSGAVNLWITMAGGGGFTGADLGVVGNDWKVQQAADFTGDGEADILWRNDSGAVALWRSATGPALGFSHWDVATVGADWQVRVAADFGGDGRADILWRNADGSTAVWTTGPGGAGFTAQDLGILSSDWLAWGG